jgi:DNA helicase II / ATP-dependent DNA helicase PcrA
MAMTYTGLNEQQLEAVKSTQKHLLVLAGAGSGKTKVLTSRVAFLIEEMKVPSEEIILLTFTNKAAQEMKERVIKLIGKAPGFAGTFHSFCARILRTYAPAVGLSHDFVIYDEDDKLMAIKMAMKNLSIEDRSLKPNGVAAAISNAKNEMIGPEEYASKGYSDFVKKISLIYREYEKLLAKFHAVDFDDLLIYGVKLLKSSSAPRILGGIGAVLVDEYQDTNSVQYKMTRLLADGDKFLTVVGDFSQSIYSWRGANFRNLLQVEIDYPDIVKVQLVKNYRSTQKILDAAYGVIANNQMHPILKLSAVSEEGEKIMVYEAPDEKAEAKFISEKINEGLRTGTVAVLYRTNAQSRTIEEELIRRGVAYSLVGGVKFYERREVKDVLAYLRVVANPSDQVSWNRIDKVGKRRRSSFEKWLAVVNEKEQKTDSMSTSDVLSGVLNATDYLSLYDENDENDLMRLENIKELASVASEFTSLPAFLENVTLVQSEMTFGYAQEEKKVTLMTIHAAKGLEFDRVILAGLEEGLFPHSRSLMDREQMEEERRLCYVAITRAKKELLLTYARKRLYFGSVSMGTPSRFLSEVPMELLAMPLTYINKPSNERRIVSDDELTAVLQDDFDEIDSW